MISVTVNKQTPCPVSAIKIKNAVKQVFHKNGLCSDCEASIAIVNQTKMLKLATDHLKEPVSLAQNHPVLAFPSQEIKKLFVFPPDNKIHLGEIIISYPHARAEAQKSGRLIDDVVCSLAEHGALHLLGIHHD